jgi:hypothetical protein
MKKIENLLLCVGAQKSGTTWLHSQLHNHPEIYFSSVKEVHYFNTIHMGSLLLSARKVAQIKKIIANNPIALQMYFTNLSRGLPLDPGLNSLLSKVDDEWYVSLLGGSQKKYAADFTPEYAILPNEGYENIKNICNNRKIIYIMRDPIERAISAIRYNIKGMNLKEDEITSDLIKAVSQKDFILSMSRYDWTIEKLKINFDEKDLKIMFFENIMNSKLLALEEISNFLGIKMLHQNNINIEDRVNESINLDISESIVSYLSSSLSPVYDYINHNFKNKPKTWSF